MDFEYTRDKFEQLLKIPSEKRTDDELYELMKLTSDFKIFESIAMNKIHKEICKYIFLKVYEKGEIIFKQGDEGDAYYYILRGSIDIYVYDIDQVDGKTKLTLVTSVLPGKGFGELSLLYDCPRTATCLPSTKSDLIVIKKKIYNTFVKDLHEKELFDLVNFYSDIPIFKKESISNILKLCLKTNKKSLLSFNPFHKVGDYINDYYFILTGSLKALIKIKMSKSLLKRFKFVEKKEFIDTVKKLQTKNLSDDIYYEVVSIMEYFPGDMVCEYYAARQHKLDVYLLPTQPTKVLMVKVDDCKKMCPQIHDLIYKYAISIFNFDNALSKLYDNESWKLNKDLLIKSNVVINNS
jgi:hypothetical protein